MWLCQTENMYRRVFLFKANNFKHVLHFSTLGLGSETDHWEDICHPSMPTKSPWQISRALEQPTLTLTQRTESASRRFEPRPWDSSERRGRVTQLISISQSEAEDRIAFVLHFISTPVCSFAPTRSAFALSSFTSSITDQGSSSEEKIGRRREQRLAIEATHHGHRR